MVQEGSRELDRRGPSLHPGARADGARPVREDDEAVQGVHGRRRNAGGRAVLCGEQRPPPAGCRDRRHTVHVHARHKPLQPRDGPHQDHGLLREHPASAVRGQQEVHVLPHLERRLPRILRPLQREPPVDPRSGIRQLLLRLDAAYPSAGRTGEAGLVQGLHVRHGDAPAHVRRQGQGGGLRRGPLVQYGGRRGERRRGRAREMRIRADVLSEGQGRGTHGAGLRRGVLGRGSGDRGQVRKEPDSAVDLEGLRLLRHRQKDRARAREHPR